MQPTRERVPPHLRRFVVEQDYDAYTAIDQSVWRFVLLMLRRNLGDTAHPAYLEGLAQTGMSVERIPRVAEMDACLARYGWGAVCVDGFIPPRAFQEFQALGILPIAAEIRTAEHLPYTPAPDIIHEAAGHAPILPERDYAAFLKRIGRMGTRAFGSRRDQDVYEAVHALSEVKERRDATPDEIAGAQARLEALANEPGEPSEATRLARLYWWTVEYGLVGTPDDYRLYGAGLLSSLGESHFCRRPGVRKLPLTRDCAEIGYDITRPQPQLFVADSFAQLGDVLDEVSARFAYHAGGRAGLDTARASGEVGTVELDSGLQVTGRVADVVGVDGAAALVVFEGPCAVSRAGRQIADHGPDAHATGFALALGRLRDGAALSALVEADLRRRGEIRDGRVALDYASGVSIRGRLDGVIEGESGRVLVLALADSVLTRGGAPAWRPPGGRHAVVAGEAATRVFAGAADSAYWPAAEYSATRVPARAAPNARQAALVALYEAAAKADRAAPAARAQVHRGLRDEYPHEWLLRWRLLESEPAGGPLRDALIAELRALEAHYRGEHPIAMGLRYLGIEYPA